VGEDRVSEPVTGPANPVRTVRVLVPDLDSAPMRILLAVEEVLLMLDGWEVDPDDPVVLPPPIADRRGLDAVNRLQDALRPTQNRQPDDGRLLAPLSRPRDPHVTGGHYEHVPISVITLPAADVVTLGQIAVELGRPGLDSDIVDALEGMAGGDVPARAELVEQTARLAGLLDLAWTADADLLAPRLIERGPGRDVVLTEAEEAVYERLADRLNRMAAGDAIARWLY
jgi:hypothetical protein